MMALQQCKVLWWHLNKMQGAGTEYFMVVVEFDGVDEYTIFVSF
jgi:hypothetical protein